MSLPANFRTFLEVYLANESIDVAPVFPDDWRGFGLPSTDSPEWKAIVAYFRAESEKSENFSKKNSDRTQFSNYFQVKVQCTTFRQRIHRALMPVGTFPYFPPFHFPCHVLWYSRCIILRIHFKSVHIVSRSVFFDLLDSASQLLGAGRKNRGKRRADASSGRGTSSSGDEAGNGAGDGGDRGDSAIRARRAGHYADASPPETHNAA
jgi:hypothetical protein